jgi:hypothetical protein
VALSIMSVQRFFLNSLKNAAQFIKNNQKGKFVSSLR